jgi:hypothetical protein
MRTVRALLAALILGAASVAANADAVTEEYTGRQFVGKGDSYTFDFDLWYANSGIVNDSAPGLQLTTDGQGAFGQWTAATLYVDFYSVDADPDYASIDLDAWGFRFLLGWPTTDVLTLNSFNVSRPTAGNTNYTFSYNLTASQLDAMDNFGWSSLRIGASRRSGYDNDFDLTRIGLSVRTAGAVPEPSVLAVLAVAMLGLGAIARRRTSA